MEKQTPVEWLALRYHHRQGYLSQDDIAEAKEMEKEHIMMAYDYGEVNEFRQNIYQCADDDVSPEQYYKKAYNK
jgi:Tfp pilus assembly protein PilF